MRKQVHMALYRSKGKNTLTQCLLKRYHPQMRVGHLCAHALFSHNEPVQLSQKLSLCYTTGYQGWTFARFTGYGRLGA